ncbi:MAG: TonB-dependent receptor, partial [Sphingobacteriaceae bacterium]
SATYSNQEGILQKNSFSNKGVLFNVNHQANKYISIGAKLSYSDQMNLAAVSSGSLATEAYSTTGLGREAVLLPSNISPYNNDGSYNTTASGIGIGSNKNFSITYPNPIPSLDLDRSNNEINHTAANVYLQIKPLSWITLKTTYGIDYVYSDNDLFTNPVSNYTITNGITTNAASATNSYAKRKEWVWDNTAQFDYTFFQKNNFSLLLGNEQQRQTTYGFGLNRSILSDPAFNQIQAGFVNVATNSLTYGENYLVSFFGRLNYNFDQKYFLSATVRRDGYSAFGPNRKYGYFPGIGASWEITREKFWENIGADKVFSSFKIRGSYAKVGNSAGIGDYASNTTYGSGLYNGVPSLVPNATGNVNLGWETSKKTDIGFDFGILKDRISGEVAYYKNNIDGLIFSVPTAPSGGLVSNPLVNIGSMYNTGLEFSLNADIVRSR